MSDRHRLPWGLMCTLIVQVRISILMFRTLKEAQMAKSKGHSIDGFFNSVLCYEDFLGYGIHWRALWMHNNGEKIHISHYQQQHKVL